jgi:hypothetical protein
VMVVIEELLSLLAAVSTGSGTTNRKFSCFNAELLIGLPKLALHTLPAKHGRVPRHIVVWWDL